MSTLHSYSHHGDPYISSLLTRILTKVNTPHCLPLMERQESYWTDKVVIAVDTSSLNNKIIRNYSLSSTDTVTLI